MMRFGKLTRANAGDVTQGLCHNGLGRPELNKIQKLPSDGISEAMKACSVLEALMDLISLQKVMKIRILGALQGFRFN